MRRGHSRPPRRSGKLLDSNDLRGTGSPRPRHAACVTVGGDLTGRRRDGPHAIESTRFHRPGCCVCGRRGRRRLCGHPTERDTRSSNRCCSARAGGRETGSGDRSGHRRRPQWPACSRRGSPERAGQIQATLLDCHNRCRLSGCDPSFTRAATHRFPRNTDGAHPCRSCPTAGSAKWRPPTA